MTADRGWSCAIESLELVTRVVIEAEVLEAAAVEHRIGEAGGAVVVDLVVAEVEAFQHVRADGRGKRCCPAPANPVRT